MKRDICRSSLRNWQRRRLMRKWPWEGCGEGNKLSRGPLTSIRQRGAAPSVGAGVAGTTLGWWEGTAWSHVHDVLQHGVGPAGSGVERQLLAVQRHGLHAATEPVSDGQTASEAWGAVLANVTAKVNGVVEVECAQRAWSGAGGGVHPVQHQFGVVTIHF